MKRRSRSPKLSSRSQISSWFLVPQSFPQNSYCQSWYSEDSVKLKLMQFNVFIVVEGCDHVMIWVILQLALCTDQQGLITVPTAVN